MSKSDRKIIKPKIRIKVPPNKVHKDKSKYDRKREKEKFRENGSYVESDS